MRHVTLPIVVALAALAATPTGASAQTPFGRHFFGLPSPLGILNGAIRGPRAFRPRAHRVTRRGQAADVAQAAEARQPYAAAAPINAYEEMLGYALWPDAYAGRFWARGYGAIMQSMVKPSAADSDGPCSAQAKEQAGRPLDRIAQTI